MLPLLNPGSSTHGHVRCGLWTTCPTHNSRFHCSQPSILFYGRLVTLHIFRSSGYFVTPLGASPYSQAPTACTIPQKLHTTRVGPCRCRRALKRSIIWKPCTTRFSNEFPNPGLAIPTGISCSYLSFTRTCTAKP